MNKMILREYNVKHESININNISFDFYVHINVISCINIKQTASIFS